MCRVEYLVVNNKLISNCGCANSHKSFEVQTHRTNAESSTAPPPIWFHHHPHPPSAPTIRIHHPHLGFGFSKFTLLFFSLFFSFSLQSSASTHQRIRTPTHPHANTSACQQIRTPMHPHANTFIRTHPHGHTHRLQGKYFFFFFLYTHLRPPPSAVTTICVSTQRVPIPIPLSLSKFFFVFFVLSLYSSSCLRPPSPGYK